MDSDLCLANKVCGIRFVLFYFFFFLGGVLTKASLLRQQIALSLNKSLGKKMFYQTEQKTKQFTNLMFLKGDRLAQNTGWNYVGGKYLGNNAKQITYLYLTNLGTSLKRRSGFN